MCQCGQIKVSLSAQKHDIDQDEFRILKTADEKVFYFTSYPEKDEQYNKIYCVEISGFLRAHDGKLYWTNQSATQREYTYWRCTSKYMRESLNNYTTAPFVNKYVDKELLFKLAKKCTSIGNEGRVYIAVNE